MKIGKNMPQNLIRAIIVAIIGIVLGYILLVIAYLIPTKYMQNNIRQSINVFDTEREYHRVIPGYISTQLDNYTDSWMVGKAVFDSGEQPIWKAALLCASADYGDGPLENLIKYELGNQGYSADAYARYWHGYLVVLKPLFLVFDYADLRVINIILESILILIVFFTLIKNNLTGEAYAYIVSILFIMPIVIPLSIQFSVVFYIANIASLVLLKRYRNLKTSGRLFIYFQFCGMATSYFDFLTYPVATLGMPMVCILIMEGKTDGAGELLARVKDIVQCSISWGFGYIAMWFGKWVLSTIILGDNIILDAFKQITMRTAHVSDGGDIDIIHTWLRNVEFYFEKPYMAVIFISIVIGIAMLVKNIKNIKNIVLNIIPFIITAIMPFVWYAAVTQHSYEHHWFTFRGTVVSVFALLCAVVSIYKFGKTTDIGDNR
jgi:hypothetical protein